MSKRLELTLAAERAALESITITDSRERSRRFLAASEPFSAEDFGMFTHNYDEAVARYQGAQGGKLPSEAPKPAPAQAQEG